MCLCAILHMNASAEMVVVVYTTDQVVVQYVCEDSKENGFQPWVRNEVKFPGRLRWHVVNGTPPYTVMKEKRDQAGNICITIKDAGGKIATGCGVMGMVTRVEVIECPYDRPRDRGPAIEAPERKAFTRTTPPGGRTSTSAVRERDTYKPRETGGGPGDAPSGQPEKDPIRRNDGVGSAPTRPPAPDPGPMRGRR
jgi:hypothetical protein